MKLNLIKDAEEIQTDQSYWWNKVRDISWEEASILPTEVLRKYATYVYKHKEQLMQNHEDINKLSLEYESIKNLEEILTQRQKNEEEKKKQRLLKGD